ncbi:hypothetical protein BOSE62_130711 [Bosea sp. 62]|nr:hypothetical protein BOSE7B_120734 [Bosea sp. 7B]CAD5274593.1 hypothetical protein BOSE21B_30180 [Bosea sp. 21B]CAD5275799.1 hypothetical protein BOSE46_30043 [Bosea sp. 46]VVT60083.1 hypothetical protein BOS5A_210874 [Bosea sp. EC-HK365B]VXB54507.1 hypothetical protein BOSE62_130711 [Bosea sp. 62]VXC15818.1 hypothetical protein BOSE29B_30172 [Bosea sp. 29B]VXC16672.1 hypothetical protein BOSE127_170374 [Bosea sp. 127]VXC69972.1 hypothetical protein BOSE125_40044 [Bosea sp. 125]
MQRLDPVDGQLGADIALVGDFQADVDAPELGRIEPDVEAPVAGERLRADLDRHDMQRRRPPGLAGSHLVGRLGLGTGRRLGRGVELGQWRLRRGQTLRPGRENRLRAQGRACLLRAAGGFGRRSLRRLPGGRRRSGAVGSLGIARRLRIAASGARSDLAGLAIVLGCGLRLARLGLSRLRRALLRAAGLGFARFAVSLGFGTGSRKLRLQPRLDVGSGGLAARARLAVGLRRQNWRDRHGDGLAGCLRRRSPGRTSRRHGLAVLSGHAFRLCWHAALERGCREREEFCGDRRRRHGLHHRTCGGLLVRRALPDHRRSVEGSGQRGLALLDRLASGWLVAGSCLARLGLARRGVLHLSLVCASLRLGLVGCLAGVRSLPVLAGIVGTGRRPGISRARLAGAIVRLRLIAHAGLIAGVAVIIETRAGTIVIQPRTRPVRRLGRQGESLFRGVPLGAAAARKRDLRQRRGTRNRRS